jgi:pimeloyl-ACP methyl ester carboxylesterase
MWNPLVKELSTNHTMVSIDLPGHGKSEVIDNEQSMDLMADVVRSILNDLDIAKAAFIGHSMGGYVALAYLERYPLDVTAIVLLNSTTKADSKVRRLNRDRALKILESNPTLFINAAIRNLFAESNVLHFENEILQLQKEASSFPISGITAMIKGMKNRKDCSRILETFQGAKYIICGSSDPVVPLSESKAIAKATKAQLKIVQGGHMILIENYAEFVKIVHYIDFL